MLLRVIIIFFLALIFFRALRFFFRILLGTAFEKNYQQQSHASRSSDANVNIDYVPDKDKKKNTLFKGGEYVDYEEVE